MHRQSSLEDRKMKLTNLILLHDPVPLFLSLSLLTPAPGPCTELSKVQQCRVETTELDRSRPETDKTERTGETGRKQWSPGTRLSPQRNEFHSFVPGGCWNDVGWVQKPIDRSVSQCLEKSWSGCIPFNSLQPPLSYVTVTSTPRYARKIIPANHQLLQYRAFPSTWATRTLSRRQ